MGENDDPERPNDVAGSGLSRRTLLAGGLLTLGGAVHLVDGDTLALFTDAGAAGGAVSVDSDPTLNYHLYDRTRNSNAAYDIAYQVEWVAGFDHVEIQVENLDSGYISGDTFSRTTAEGSVSYPRGGGSDGGAGGDTYRFTFRAYKRGQSSPVLQKVVEDQTDGNDTGQGNFGNANSPAVEWIILEDRTDSGGGRYTAYYEVTHPSNASLVRARFADNDAGSWATTTDTSTNTPNGALAYDEGGTDGDQFDVTVAVEDGSGLVVDSTTISDVADGTDPAWYGDPVRSDSPQLDTFTLTDESTGGQARYTVEYTVTTTNRLAGVRIAFRDVDNNWASTTATRGGNSATGTVSYQQGGTGGDRFAVTVEVLETRNGVTFPIDSGTLTDVADGGSAKTWPDDA
ncbi:MAG: hypothetical protein ABEJ89_06785 [Haloarculaceae archaeon]